MNKVEQVLKFLVNSNSNKFSSQNEEIPEVENMVNSDHPGNESLVSESKHAKSKRTNCFQEGNDSDFDFLVTDDSLKELKEFDINEMTSKVKIHAPCQTASGNKIQRPKLVNKHFFSDNFQNKL